VAPPLINFLRSRINTVVEGANDVRLMVKCDGDEFHSPGRWQAGMHRQRILESAGRVFWHCFASTWALRKHEVLDELIERMRRMGIEPLGALERTPSLVEHRKWPQREPAQEEETAMPADAETGVPR